MTRPSLADDVWLTTADVAKRAHRHPATVRAAAANGTLKSTQAGRGRGRRYRVEWVDAWMGDTIAATKAAS